MRKLLSMLLAVLLLTGLLAACDAGFATEYTATPPKTEALEPESAPEPVLEPEPESEPEPEALPDVYVRTISDELRIAAMSASLTSVLAILEDGSLWQWGALDDEAFWDWMSGEGFAAPVWVMDDVVQAVAGPSHHLAIDANGMLWAWGENHEWGKLGDGTSEPRPRPVPILEDVVYAAISPVTPNSHVGDGVRSYAITSDGTLWGWGQNGSGFEWLVVLGDGTDVPRSSPVWIMDAVSSVTPTRGGAYATGTDGTVWWWGQRWGWGEDAFKEGANPNDSFWSETRLYPARVDEPDYVPFDWRWTDFQYEIDENGTLWTWGVNQLPEHWWYMPLVGDGTTVARPEPVQIMEGIRSVTAIADTVFVIDLGGRLWAWGPNNLGQLGDGTMEMRLSPVSIMENVAEISAHYFMDHGTVGFMNTFVLTADGELWRIGSLRGHGGHVLEGQGEPELLPGRLRPWAG